MAEREFVTYDGVKFRKYTGEEIGNTGHYKVDIEKVKDVTIAGNFLDSQENVKNFRKDFYRFINLNNQNSPRAGYNYILIGENLLYSFHYRISNYASDVPEVDDLFNGFLDLLESLGLMNSSYVIENGQTYKRIKIPMTTRNKPYKNFNLYFIPLDNNCIRFSDYNIDKEDVQ